MRTALSPVRGWMTRLRTVASHATRDNNTSLGDTPGVRHPRCSNTTSAFLKRLQKHPALVGTWVTVGERGPSPCVRAIPGHRQGRAPTRLQRHYRLAAHARRRCCSRACIHPPALGGCRTTASCFAPHCLPACIHRVERSTTRVSLHDRSTMRLQRCQGLRMAVAMPVVPGRRLPCN